jgi:hypothetical protein
MLPSNNPAAIAFHAALKSLSSAVMNKFEWLRTIFTKVSKTMSVCDYKIAAWFLPWSILGAEHIFKRRCFYERLCNAWHWKNRLD